jgi:bifunctional DNase/RNase
MVVRSVSQAMGRPITIAKKVVAEAKISVFQIAL